MNVTRAFTGRPRVDHAQLPPGQYDAGDDWPVLSAEVTPDLAPADWTFRIDGLVAEPRTWNWEQAHALPASAYEGDIHCVTSWSKFGRASGCPPGRAPWTPCARTPPPTWSPTCTPGTRRQPPCSPTTAAGPIVGEYEASHCPHGGWRG